LKTYETVIILDERKVQDEGKSFVEDYTSQLTAMGGELIRSRFLGRRQFAREVKKRKNGIYWNFIVAMAEKSVRPLREKYRLDERVLRQLTFIYDRLEDPRAPRAETTAEKPVVLAP